MRAVAVDGARRAAGGLRPGFSPVDEGAEILNLAVEPVAPGAVDWAASSSTRCSTCSAARTSASIFLEVRQSNAAAISSTGAWASARYPPGKRYYRNPTENALTMALQLARPTERCRKTMRTDVLSVDKNRCGAYSSALSVVPESCRREGRPVSRSLNKVMLIGNLGADPEVRSTSNGSRVATLSLATSRQWTTQGGEKQEKTEWHRCVVWNGRKTGGGLADVVEKYLKKGDRVYVEGRIEYRTWQDREGQTRYTTEINVSDMVMLSGRGDGGSGESGRRASASAPGAAAAAPAPGGAGTAAGAESGKAESFSDFPEALDEEDDDLPF